MSGFYQKWQERRRNQAAPGWVAMYPEPYRSLMMARCESDQDFRKRCEAARTQYDGQREAMALECYLDVH